MTQFGLWATDDGSVGPDDDLLHAQLTGLGGPLVITTPVSSPPHAACDVRLIPSSLNPTQLQPISFQLPGSGHSWYNYTIYDWLI